MPACCLAAGGGAAFSGGIARESSDPLTVETVTHSLGVCAAAACPVAVSDSAAHRLLPARNDSPLLSLPHSHAGGAPMTATKVSSGCGCQSAEQPLA